MTSVLVASEGGHLRQLATLRPRLGLPDDVLWVTHESDNADSLLAGENVVFAPYVAPRSTRGVARITAVAQRVFRDHDVSRVISTGALPAIPFLGYARLHRVPGHYIESAARSAGPSASGRVVARYPGINLYSQYRGWAGGRWHYAGSVFDEYQPGPPVTAPEPPAKVVVTVGMTPFYNFSRLFERLLALLPPQSDVLWQTGPADLHLPGIQGVGTLPAADLEAAMREADLVVAHAGTGSALTAMAAGKAPVLVPRLARYQEHVDDHQTQIARELSDLGLAVASHVADLSPDVFAAAMSRSVRRRPEPPPYRLLRDPMGGWGGSPDRS